MQIQRLLHFFLQRRSVVARSTESTGTTQYDIMPEDLSDVAPESLQETMLLLPLTPAIHCVYGNVLLGQFTNI